MNTRALLVGAALALAATAMAQDDDERQATHSWLLDVLLNERERPELDVVTEGDVLVVSVDPTRIFGADSISDKGLALPMQALDGGVREPRVLPDGGFAGDVQAAATVTPELRYFYVSSQEATGYQMQPGPCTPGQDVDAGPALECVQERFTPEKGWPVSNGLRVYRCPELTDTPLSARLGDGGTNPWSLVQRNLQKPAEAPECINSWGDIRVASGRSVESVQVLYSRGGLSPQRFDAARDADGIWAANVTLLSGTADVLVRVKFKDGTVQELALDRFRVRERDTHSRVRVQAELLATERLRRVGLGIAITPILNERFFTDGPWSPKCVFCTTGPMVLLKLTNDNASVLQFGVGWSVYATRSLHFNAGLLFGTKDLSSGWNPSRSWFIGIALDPILLTEARTLN